MPTRAVHTANCAFRGSVVYIGAIFLLLNIAVSPGEAKSAVIFRSPCSCKGDRGVTRWAVKTDRTRPPTNNLGISHVTPADIYQWRGPSFNITDHSGRIPAEEKWYAVTGRVQRVIYENDGDLHIIMKNADHRAGKMVVEIPPDPPWCAIRKAVVSWTNAKFPFRTDEQWGFYLLRHPVVTVIGKAFYDIDHSGKNPDKKSPEL
jgi:hypothetical protein